MLYHDTGFKTSKTFQIFLENTGKIFESLFDIFIFAKKVKY